MEKEKKGYPTAYQALCAKQLDTHPLAWVPLLFRLSDMGRKRFGIITFAPDRVEKLSWQGEGHSLAWIIWRGLCGWTYPKERGIINITLMDQLPAKPHPSEELLE